MAWSQRHNNRVRFILIKGLCSHVLNHIILIVTEGDSERWWMFMWLVHRGIFTADMKYFFRKIYFLFSMFLWDIFFMAPRFGCLVRH